MSRVNNLAKGNGDLRTIDFSIVTSERSADGFTHLMLRAYAKAGVPRSAYLANTAYMMRRVEERALSQGIPLDEIGDEQHELDIQRINEQILREDLEDRARAGIGI